MSDDKLIRLSDAITALRSADLPFGYGHAAEVIRAIPAVQVVVNPLEWVEIRSGQYFEARVIGILYSVRLGTDGVVRWQAGHMGTWHEAPTIEAAKAAAQADYDARIRSALTVQPSPDVAALVEAVIRLNSACDAMWNDHERLERNPDSLGQKYRLKEVHLRAISEAQQNLPLTLARVKAEMSAIPAVQPTVSPDVAEQFEKADWYWRTMDPDDCGASPEEAVNRGMLGRFCVCEIASSYTGPTRYGFIAPALDPESDDEEFVHFSTHEEAMEAAKARAALARVKGGAR